MKFMIYRPYDGECLKIWEPRGAENTPLELWPQKLTKKLDKIPGFSQVIVIQQETEIDGKEVVEDIVTIDLDAPDLDDGICIRYPYKEVATVDGISEVVDRTARVQLLSD